MRQRATTLHQLTMRVVYVSQIDFETTSDKVVTVTRITRVMN